MSVSACHIFSCSSFKFESIPNISLKDSFGYQNVAAKSCFFVFFKKIVLLTGCYTYLLGPTPQTAQTAQTRAGG